MKDPIVEIIIKETKKWQKLEEKIIMKFIKKD